MNLPKTIRGYGVQTKSGAIIPMEKPLPNLGAEEVLLKVLSCGICHSDIHLIDDDWGVSKFPLVPGHEILGEVIEMGKGVVGLQRGNIVGVGWQRSACLVCDECLSNRDNMCSEKIPTCVGHWGGYADYHVADSRFCFRMPGDDTNPALAPLLCGGATIFTPLAEFLNDARTRTPRVGVVSLGGLGHLAVKFAAAMGMEVTVFSSTSSKNDEAIALGAAQVISSKDSANILAAQNMFDLVLVTSNVDLPWESYVETLRADGTLCFVGIPPSPLTISVSSLLDKRRRIAGSPISSRYHIRRMLEFARLHGITAKTETFPMSKAADAVGYVRSGKPRYRAVLVNQ